jgi:hypothetical protein
MGAASTAKIRIRLMAVLERAGGLIRVVADGDPRLGSFQVAVAECPDLSRGARRLAELDVLQVSSVRRHHSIQVAG